MKNDFDELAQLELALRVLKRLNKRRQQPGPALAVGDRVRFQATGRGVLQGSITSIRGDRATLSVDGESSPWRIDLAALAPAEPAASEGVREAKVIPFPTPPDRT